METDVTPNTIYLRAFKPSAGRDQYDIYFEWEAQTIHLRARLLEDEYDRHFWSTGHTTSDRNTQIALLFLKIATLGGRWIEVFRTSHETFSNMVRENPAAYSTSRAGVEGYLDLLHSYGMVGAPGSVLRAEATAEGRLRASNPPDPAHIVRSVNFQLLNSAEEV